MHQSVLLTEVFQAPPEVVWNALTQKEALRHWYFDIPDFELKEGAVFNFFESSEQQYHHQCMILEVQEGRVLKHTWTHPGHSQGSSVLCWSLEPAEEGHTRVALNHEGIDTFADAGADFTPANFEAGWQTILRVNLRNYLYHIERLSFSIVIPTSAARVWNCLWDSASYRVWTAPFCEGSYYEGVMAPEETIHFLTPQGSGMYSKVLYMIPERKMIFSHISVLKNGVAQPLTAEIRHWTGSLEIYSLSEQNGQTTVRVEVDVERPYKAYMQEKFPMALAVLKQVCMEET